MTDVLGYTSHSVFRTTNCVESLKDFIERRICNLTLWNNFNQQYH